MFLVWIINLGGRNLLNLNRFLTAYRYPVLEPSSEKRLVLESLSRRMRRGLVRVAEHGHLRSNLICQVTVLIIGDDLGLKEDRSWLKGLGHCDRLVRDISDGKQRAG